MRNIGQERIQSIRLPIPPVDDQLRIVAEVERRITTVERTEDDVDAQLRRAARLRLSILQRAFEGRLVGQDSTDQPASVFLDRIRVPLTDVPSSPRRTSRPRPTSAR